ncbi:xylan 1,4-beta-xylosidase [Actinomadura barringtoniae]|uniref:Xylan 1,4-beta-xylosidase n=1 Tax=Actinomadura barringtoniae TaxID=1427535 RepID=A0A939T324_9ACTN|nr:xylan 1,4-beta-xylosidase [Actinomadura barringtoniae]MBO2450516.1 xylan 1,4-beta-xylosidase [Actinomadura barringtoniae]
MDVRPRASAGATALFRNRHGRHGRPRQRLALIALAAAIACLLVLTLALALTGWRPFGGGKIDPSAPVTEVAPGVGKNWPSWGITHTQVSVDGQQGPAQALRDLTAQPTPQVTPIMGWGVDNPEPRPGQFNWNSLDRRMQTIRQTKGTPVVTLCCAPDWMKGGAAGTTDWGKLEVAVNSQHFDDFAALSAAVAKRYPDVKYYAVWNEFKGFWNQGANRWDQEGYTTLYNKVYTALKKVNKNIKVGGPYMVVNSNAPGSQNAPPSELQGTWGSMDQRDLNAIKYWDQHKKGADFLAVDGHAMPSQREVRLNEFQALTKFSDVTRWLRGLDSDLPVWWAEWYVEPVPSDWTDERRGAVLTAAMMEFVRGGAASAFYWSPQTSFGADCAGCLWFGSANGNAATPTLAMVQNFDKWFPPGTRLVGVPSSNQAVRVLAQPRQMVVVNTTPGPARSQIEGRPVDLGPYEVKWISR